MFRIFAPADRILGIEREISSQQLVVINENVQQEIDSWQTRTEVWMPNAPVKSSHTKLNPLEHGKSRLNECEYLKIIYVNCGKISEYESDLRSNEHYLSSCENKAWKKIQACTEFEPMTSAIPVQCSTNWANKPTGSWSLCWFQIEVISKWLWIYNNIFRPCFHYCSSGVYCKIAFIFNVKIVNTSIEQRPVQHPVGILL